MNNMSWFPYFKSWFPYIKPTKKIHDSGFRMFEVGYIAGNLKDKVVIGSCSDHIWINNLFGSMKDSNIDINIDLLKGGEIRFFSHEEKGIKWRDDAFCLSTMQLEIGLPDCENINKKLKLQFINKYLKMKKYLKKVLIALFIASSIFWIFGNDNTCSNLTSLEMVAGVLLYLYLFLSLVFLLIFNE